MKDFFPSRYFHVYQSKLLKQKGRISLKVFLVVNCLFNLKWNVTGYVQCSSMSFKKGSETRVAIKMWSWTCITKIPLVVCVCVCVCVILCISKWVCVGVDGPASLCFSPSVLSLSLSLSIYLFHSLSICCCHETSPTHPCSLSQENEGVAWLGWSSQNH